MSGKQNSDVTDALNGARAQVILWMLNEGLSTGHGDTMANLLSELSEQIADYRARITKLAGERDHFERRVLALESRSAA
jgi:hypothetical protein